MPFAVVALVAALTATDVCGQNTWVGGVGGDGLWATGTNWSTASAPAGSYNQTLVFAGSPLLSSTNNVSGLNLTSGTVIRFDAAGFSLSGSAITVGGTIANSTTSGTNTLNNNMVLGSTVKTITGSSGSTLVIGGNVSGFGFTTGNLSGSGTSRFVLSGNNTMTGTTTLSANTLLVLGHAGALGNGTLRARNGFLDVTGPLEVASTVLFDPNGNSVTFLGSSSLSLTGTTRIGNNNVTVNVAGSTLTLKSLENQPGIANLLALRKSGTGTLVITDAAQAGFTRSVVSVEAGVLRIGNGAALGTGTVQLTSGTLQTSGVMTIANVISGSGGWIGGDHDFTLSGSIAGGTLNKSGNNTVTLSAVNAYTGVTSVNAGTLRVDGSILSSPTVTVASGATLGGSGSVVAITGAGLVSPGNSPGILNGTSVTLSSGLDFAFEFSQPGAPTWSTGTASGNDVLRLTNLTTPISGNATAANVFDIYFAADGQTYRGGLFTDRTSSFESSIANATYNYFVQSATGTVTFNGTKYDALAPADVTRSTVQVTSASFSGGTVSNGYTMEFVVVPEPQTIVLFGIGSVVIGWSLLNRRRRTAD